MQYETKLRSVFKSISWRTLATMTTAVLVYVFTGEFTLALTIGLIEVFAKMGLYFIHERLWQRIRYGKREVPSFVIWLTGLPSSGKKAIGSAVYKELLERELKVDRLDSHDVRPLFPENGFSPEEVHLHVKRSGLLAARLEKNGVAVVASFVSPYRESRDFVRRLSKNFVEVYLRTTPEACEKRDTKSQYPKARRGESGHFPGVHVPYEESSQPEIVVDVDTISVEQATEQIMTYLKSGLINTK